MRENVLMKFVFDLRLDTMDPFLWANGISRISAHNYRVSAGLLGT